MPVIKRTNPLLPEGEYCGQARKVNQEWSKPKPRPDGTKPEPVMVFRIPLHTHDGRVITTILRVMDSTGWTWEQACKSGEMIPEADDFTITPDDFENRVFYFGVVHSEWQGQPKADVKFHTKTHAVQVNPALADVTFPNAAPRPISLRAAPTAPAAPQTAAASSPAASTAPTQAPPFVPDDTVEGLSEAEFREAMEYAKKLQRDKQGPKDQAA